MSPFRCPDCEKNVALQISEPEVLDTRFEEDGFSVEVDIRMDLMCDECQNVLSEYEGTSVSEIKGMEEYLEEHDDIDISEAECGDAEISGYKDIMRNGRKTYVTKWATNVKLGRKTFKVNGELAFTQDQLK